MEVQSNNGVITSLKNWKVYNIPVDYAFAQNKKFVKQDNPQKYPAYYRGTFTLDKTGDTFLNMTNWSKGMVWVNSLCYWTLLGNWATTNLICAGMLVEERRE